MKLYCYDSVLFSHKGVCIYGLKLGDSCYTFVDTLAPSTNSSPPSLCEPHHTSTIPGSLSQLST